MRPIIYSAKRSSRSERSRGPKIAFGEAKHCGREKTAPLRLEKERMDVYLPKMEIPEGLSGRALVWNLKCGSRGQ
jgi:hypothetical protein